MAEQEVIKHTKKVYKVWGSKEHGFWYKLKEFLIEIFIIVFAVTVSIWLHNLSEHKHQQEDVKVFLLGLREDLKSDIREMMNDSLSYERTTADFKYITSIDSGQILSKDSVKKHIGSIFNITILLPNIGRFEGFKSSGKLGFIEDKKLENRILDLYQEGIPSLILSTNIFNESKKELVHFINLKRKKHPDNLNVILSEDEGQNLSASLFFTREILQRYSICLRNSQEIIDQINVLYPREKAE